MNETTSVRPADRLQNIVSNLPDGIYAITGLSKNAGKTSFLNQLVSYYPGKCLGVLTTGRDGEEQDAVYGNQKPGVKLPAGVLFSTLAGVLETRGSAVQIIRKLAYKAGTQNLWLAKTTRAVEVEIIGPATVAGQIATAELMLKHGARVVLIDGSLDRKSIALCPEVNGIFLVAGSSYGNLAKIRNEVERLYVLSNLEKYSGQFGINFAEYIMYKTGEQWVESQLTSLLEQEQEFVKLLTEHKPDAVYLPGALTDSVLPKILPAMTEVKTIVFRHPLQIQLSKAALDNLVCRHKVCTLNSMHIICLALNSWSVKGEHLDSVRLRSEIRNLLPELPVFDIKEGWLDATP